MFNFIFIDVVIKKTVLKETSLPQAYVLYGQDNGNNNTLKLTMPKVKLNMCIQEMYTYLFGPTGLQLPRTKPV